MIRRAATLKDPVDFEKAKPFLPLSCLSIFGTVPRETRTALAEQIEALSASNISASPRAPSVAEAAHGERIAAEVSPAA